MAHTIFKNLNKAINNLISIDSTVKVQLSNKYCNCTNNMVNVTNGSLSDVSCLTFLNFNLQIIKFNSI